MLSACSFAAGMNNSDVIRMAKGTAPTSEIIKKINSSEDDFRLFPEDIRHLRDRHVPEPVIDAMIARNQLQAVNLPVQNGSYQPKPRPSSPVRACASQGPRVPCEALILNQGTPVRLRVISNISSGYMRLDDRVHFEVLDDVVVKNGVDSFVVIERGTPALGTITGVNPTRFYGRYGTVEVALDGVELANGDHVALTGTESGDRHIRPGLLVFLTAPVGLVVQPKNPVWLTPMGPASVNHQSVIKDGRDIKVMSDGVARLLTSEFPLLQP
jgi:hypothetical protein